MSPHQGWCSYQNCWMSNPDLPIAEANNKFPIRTISLGWEGAPTSHLVAGWLHWTPSIMEGMGVWTYLFLLQHCSQNHFHGHSHNYDSPHTLLRNSFYSKRQERAKQNSHWSYLILHHLEGWIVCSASICKYFLHVPLILASADLKVWLLVYRKKQRFHRIDCWDHNLAIWVTCVTGPTGKIWVWLVWLILMIKGVFGCSYTMQAGRIKSERLWGSS